jgi:hypothetical protein
MPRNTRKQRASRLIVAARHARDAVDADADAEKRDARAEKRRRTVRSKSAFLNAKNSAHRACRGRPYF